MFYWHVGIGGFTHLSLDKMAAALADDIFKYIFLNENGRILIEICSQNSNWQYTIIGSYNGLAPERRQAIIWTNAGILLIGPLGTHLSEIVIEIHTLSFKKMYLKMLSAKWQPSCLGIHM